MVDISRILCPVDFSDFSRRALDYAIGIARWYDARVTVLHVAPVGVPAAAMAGAPDVAGPPVLSPVERARLEVDLHAFVNAERATGVPTDVEVVEGPIWREIATRGRALGADLLVLGTHGRSGFERLLLGSVTEKLLREAPCPVLTVPRAAPGAVPSAPGLFKRILCPTDFKPAADRATAWAISLAEEAKAELLMLHVVEDQPSTARLAQRHATGSEYHAAYTEWCRRQLHDVVPARARTRCTVREVVLDGAAATGILDAALDHDCDLIVMGVAGHRGLGERIFGSTSQHVVRAATCPVLTVCRER